MNASTQFRHLLQGADDGLYSLPNQIVEARAAMTRVEKAASAHRPPDIEASRADIRHRILAQEDGESPSPADLVTLETERRAYDAWRMLVREAAETADRQLATAIFDSRDELIVEHLRPAHTAAIAVGRKHADMAPLTDLRVRAALNVTQRRRVDALVGASVIYAACTSARHLLVRGQLVHDTEGIFGELRDFCAIWPTWRQRGKDAPWPAEPVQRLAWIATHASPWLPTAAEQDERWLEEFGEVFDQARHNRQQLRGFAAVFR